MSWIKLHRKILFDELWTTDHAAIHIFLTLLLSVNHEKGKRDYTRAEIAEMSGLKPNTVYKILKRLERNKMIEVIGNNRYSTVSICNWATYQSASNSKSDNDSNNKTAIKANSSVTTKSRFGNRLSNNKKDGQLEHLEPTIVAVDNRSVTDSVTTKSRFGNNLLYIQEYINNKKKNFKTINFKEKEIFAIYPELDIILSFYVDVFGLKELPNRLNNIRAARDLLHNHGLVETMEIILFSFNVSGEKFAPQATSLVKMKDKLPDLAAYKKRMKPEGMINDEDFSGKKVILGK